MANQLDELNPEVREEGLDTNVIAKKLPVKVGIGSTIFEILLWVLGIIPGVIFLFMKIKAKNYFSQLEQKIQANASQIDNYLEQRVVVLQNCARLLDKAIDLDKLAGSVNVAFENYPELQAHDGIRDAMQQNMYLQREITAARELYNDTITTWNREIFAWPTKMIVAAKQGYTTRIPFTASQEIKQKAKDVFF